MIDAVRACFDRLAQSINGKLRFCDGLALRVAHRLHTVHRFVRRRIMPRHSVAARVVKRLVRAECSGNHTAPTAHEERQDDGDEQKSSPHKERNTVMPLKLNLVPKL